MKLNKKIEQQRKKLRLSRREISEELKIPESKFTNWEQNKSTPKLKDVVMLADYFGITTDELLGRKIWHTNTPKKDGAYLVEFKKVDPYTKGLEKRFDVIAFVNGVWIGRDVKRWRKF